MTDKEIRYFEKTKEIPYVDAVLFVYIKGLLEGFPYERNIRQVVIDEAQDGDEDAMATWSAFINQIQNMCSTIFSNYAFVDIDNPHLEIMVKVKK